MLCPEVWDFPPPKIRNLNKKCETLEDAMKTINMNYFYKSLIVTCPDEIQIPNAIEEILSEDNDYYKISDCSLNEFLDPTFIKSFVLNGKLHCFSSDRNCIVENCAAVTPDGVLTLHVLEFIYQTLGLEGKKRPHNFYEIRIDLKALKQIEKIKQALQKLETFNFYIQWEPDNERICPSSIAKYFHNKDISVSLCTFHSKKLSPTVKEIPSVKDVEPTELVEWIGMLAHEADLEPTEAYISTYSQPESNFSLKSTRIALLIVKGFLTPTLICKVTKVLSEFVASRDLENYWASVSVQSYEDSLWQWSCSDQKMFQAHDSSTNVFLTQNGQSICTVGLMKYS